MKRRTVLNRLVGVASLAVLAPPLGAAERARTPAQSEGPFYPLDVPPDAQWNLLRGGANGEQPKGRTLSLSGRVILPSGQPLAGARVEIWQADHQGIYDHPHAAGHEQFDKGFHGFGAAVTDAAGRYRFLTQVPVRYTGRPPHIHAKIFNAGRELLTTQLYIKGHPSNGSDGIFSRLVGGDRRRLMMDIRAATSGSAVQHATSFEFVV